MLSIKYFLSVDDADALSVCPALLAGRVRRTEELTGKVVRMDIGKKREARFCIYSLIVLFYLITDLQ